jgi:hypothetical protein
MRQLLDQFPDAITYLNVLYDTQSKEKEDSWRSCTMQFLFRKILEEWLEASNKPEETPNPEFDYREIADVVLVGLMIIQRELLKQ